MTLLFIFPATAYSMESEVMTLTLLLSLLTPLLTPFISVPGSTPLLLPWTKFKVDFGVAGDSGGENASDSEPGVGDELVFVWS